MAPMHINYIYTVLLMKSIILTDHARQTIPYGLTIMEQTMNKLQTFLTYFISSTIYPSQKYGSDAH